MFIHKINREESGSVTTSGTSSYGSFDGMLGTVIIENTIYIASDNIDNDIFLFDLNYPFPTFGSASSFKFLNDDSGSGYKVTQMEIVQSKLMIVAQNSITGNWYMYRAELDFSNPVQIHQSTNKITMGTA